jgi:hypothetical protein
MGEIAALPPIEADCGTGVASVGLKPAPGIGPIALEPRELSHRIRPSNRALPSEQGIFWTLLKNLMTNIQRNVKNT